MKASICLLIFFIAFPGRTATREVKVLPEGRFAPLYGMDKGQKDFPVKSFGLDVRPVTVQEFERFQDAHTEWRKDKASRLYVDANYLAPRKSVADSPVVSISWFAADAYCRAQGGRLPKTLEWEYAAAASATQRNAIRNAVFIDKILTWYSTPDSDDQVLVVGRDEANTYGIHDLHGLIWEWTSDFNSVFVAGDDRGDGDKAKGFFCGAGAIGARSKEDYAGFVRYSLRSGLRADFTLRNLGFRCAYDL